MREMLQMQSRFTKQRGRRKYSYADVVLLSWLFRMKQEGLPVNRFRRGIAYLREFLAVAGSAESRK